MNAPASTRYCAQVVSGVSSLVCVQSRIASAGTCAVFDQPGFYPAPCSFDLWHYPSFDRVPEGGYCAQAVAHRSRLTARGPRK